MKTRSKTMTARQLMRVKCRVVGGVLVVVAFGLALLSLELVTSQTALAPVAAAFAFAGAACLSLGAALCFSAAGEE